MVRISKHTLQVHTDVYILILKMMKITICDVSTLTIHLFSFTGQETAPDTLVPPPNGMSTMLC